MFELTKTYTCNGCSATATESKAKKWVHLNNSPDDGKLSMDFCPKCYDMISAMFTNTTINSTAEPVAVKPSVDAEPAVTETPSVTDKSTAAPSKPDIRSEVPEQFVEFYKQLYARVFYAIACDDQFKDVCNYVKYVPGCIRIDENAKNTNTQLTIICNDKRVSLKRDTISTEIKISKGSSTLMTRKVSKYSAVQALLNDTGTSAVSLLPEHPLCYEVAYIKECLADINKAIADGVELHELKGWIEFAAMQAGFKLYA